MNRERAKELLPIIQAFAEGKEIQFRMEVSMDGWSDLHEETAFTFPADDYEYRIKPEPFECWVTVLGGFDGKRIPSTCHLSREGAAEVLGEDEVDSEWRIAHMREAEE